VSGGSPANESADEAVEEAVEELTETVKPPAGLWRLPTEPAHIDKVRREIARYVVIPLAALYSLVVVAGVFFSVTDERLTQLVASLAGLSSLAAAVIGFYFGQSSKDRS